MGEVQEEEHRCGYQFLSWFHRANQLFLGDALGSFPLLSWYLEAP